MMDADDEEVDAAASSVGALHMNPFRSNGGAGLTCAPWSRQQATAAFAKHVHIALSLALGAKACDQDYHMAVVLAMKKDGLVLSGSCQEGRPAHAPVRSAAVATDECCVALAFTQAHQADRACPSVWPAQFIYELVEDFAGAAIEAEIFIDNRRDSGRASAWALLAGVPLVARTLEELEQRESRRYLQDWPEGTAGWRNVRTRRSWGEKSVTAHRHFFNLQQRRSHCLKKI